MKSITIVLAAAGTLLAGCVAYPDQYGVYGPYGGDSSYSTSGPNYSSGSYYGSATYYDDGRQYRGRDSDGDGVRNRDDRRPYDARRY